MKKISLIVLSLAALTLVSCSKEPKGDTFSRAEIIFQVTNADGNGPAGENFWDYMDCVNAFLDDEGDNYLTQDNPKYTYAFRTPPTSDQSSSECCMFYGRTKGKMTGDVKVDFCISVKWVIYDRNGKEIRQETPASIKRKGTISWNEFHEILGSTYHSAKFELCHGPKGKNGAWIYYFEVSPWHFSG